MADAAKSCQAALDAAARRFRAAGIENPRSEARILLAHALGMTTTETLARLDTGPAPQGFDDLVARRVRHEPVALITGRREFWSLPFAVSSATLIPRPESETVVAAALAAMAGRTTGRVLDLGTGTGCLLIAILTEWPGAWGAGVDRVPEAATLARSNAASLGVAGRASFVCGNWAEALHGPFDLIVSNPPYIKSGDIPGLMTDVAAFEPASALDGGPDGLAAYRLIVGQIPRLLSPGGAAVLEVGEGQAASVGALGKAAGLRASTAADLSGISRAVIFRSAM